MMSDLRYKNVLSSIAFAIASLAASASPVFAAPAEAGAKNIVLVHGYFADGSGWKSVADLLTRDGYKVAVVQEPETSLTDDVKATNRVIDAQDGPTILVGHSYGGVVITEAGNNPKVTGLVYVAAFQPDAGESAMDLAKKMPSASTAIKVTADGYLFLDPASFNADFAADVPTQTATFMAVSQVLPNAQSFGTPITSPAWKTKPSWAVVSTADRMINPKLEIYMSDRAKSTTVRVLASHAVYVSHPSEITKIIEDAAQHANP